MSNSNASFIRQTPPQSIAEVIAPGVIGLFIQGIQCGFVLTQLSRWLFLERTDSPGVVALVIFVTVAGFVQTAVCFASAWRIYVRNFGEFIFPEWTESVHVVLSTLIAVPVQGFFIWRCHYILKKNLYCTIPLVLASIGSVVTAILVSLYAFRHGSIRPADGKGYHPSAGRIWCPFLAFLLIPTILDIAITIIMLRYLTSSLKNVHTDHLRRRISRFIIVVWQAAIPPCICTILLLIKYLVFTTSHPREQQMWYSTIQAILGKLYVLSLFYTLNNRMELARSGPTTYISTLTTPLEGTDSLIQCGGNSTTVQQYALPMHSSGIRSPHPDHH